jgi:hypothetical protein
MAGGRGTTVAAVLMATFAVSNAPAEIRIGIAAPLTAGMAWGGEQTQVGAYMAREDRR